MIPAASKKLSLEKVVSKFSMSGDDATTQTTDFVEQTEHEYQIRRHVSLFVLAVKAQLYISSEMALSLAINNVCDFVENKEVGDTLLKHILDWSPEERRKIFELSSKVDKVNAPVIEANKIVKEEERKKVEKVQETLLDLLEDQRGPAGEFKKAFRDECAKLAPGQKLVDKEWYPETQKEEAKKQVFDSHDLGWFYLEDEYPGGLFGRIACRDVEQGAIGDCYLIAALIAMANNPRYHSWIQRLFTCPEYYKQGAACVSFFRMGEEVPIKVDTRVLLADMGLIFSDPRRARFARPAEKDSSFWHCVVEKAFSKAAGSYSAIFGGNSDAAFYNLTNTWSYTINLPKGKETALAVDEMEKIKTLWKELLEFHKSGTAVMCCGTLRLGNPVSEDETGLSVGHAYAILDVRLLGGRHKLLCIQNPWRWGEWGRGSEDKDWSDKSRMWTEAYKQEVGLTDKDDGMFWMSFDDFVKNFSTVYLADQCEGWIRHELRGTVIESFYVQDVEQYLVRWPTLKGTDRIELRWNVETNRTGLIHFEWQCNGGKRIKDLEVGLPKLETIRSGIVTNHEGGVLSVSECLDQVWTMAVRGMLFTGTKWVLTIWCRVPMEFTLTEGPKVTMHEMLHGRTTTGSDESSDD
jgi:hypothetical protein